MPQQAPQMGPGNRLSALEAQLARPPNAMGAQGQQQVMMFQGRPTRKIWEGELSWKNPKSDSSQEQQPHSVVCTVSSQLNETQTEPIVRSDNWPQKLIMQLIPKSLVQQIGGTPSKYFQNARSVLFHFTDNPAKESLTKVFIQGYAGCVHFHVSFQGTLIWREQNCRLRMLK